MDLTDDVEVNLLHDGTGTKHYYFKRPTVGWAYHRVECSKCKPDEHRLEVRICSIAETLSGRRAAIIRTGLLCLLGLLLLGMIAAQNPENPVLLWVGVFGGFALLTVPVIFWWFVSRKYNGVDGVFVSTDHPRADDMYRDNIHTIN